MAASGWSTDLPISVPSGAAAFLATTSSQDRGYLGGITTQGSMVNLSGRTYKTESHSSVLQRYSGALEMLRNQLWNSTARGNLSFEEGDSNEEASTTHLSSRDMDPSHLVLIERDLCVRSALYVQRLLERADDVPSSVLDAVFSDEEVVHRLRNLHDNLTFAKRLYLPEDELDPGMLKAVRTASSIFNGTCVPVVMWPCTDPSISDSGRVRIEDSTVFEALQIYCLRKHNRELYVEWGRTAAGFKTDSGPLAVDVTDAVIIREISDTILDEIIATLWSIGYLALHMHSVGSDKLRPYASAILTAPDDLTSRLWKYYLSFSDHVKLRFAHIKDVDASLKEKLNGRVIVELYRIVRLQCAIIKAISDIHIGTRSMTMEEYERYAAHFESRNFTGAYAIARTLVGTEECAGSQLLNHAVHELQALGTLLLSSFFLYRCFGADKGSATRDSFLSETTTYMRSQLTALEKDQGDNRSRAILIFAYASYLKRLSLGDAACNVDLKFVEHVSTHLDRYVSSLEWMALSRDILGFKDNTAAGCLTTFPIRMLLIESISSVIDTFGIESLPCLDNVVNAICMVVVRDGNFDRGHQSTKLSLLERISTYLMSQFPFGLNTLFQLLGAFLPSCATSQDDDTSMDIDNDYRSMELIVRFLLSKFHHIVISPLGAPLEYKSDTGEIELTEDLYVGTQLLHMLGLDKRLIIENWFSWEMGNSMYVLRSGSMGKPVIVNDLRNLSLNASSHSHGDHEDLWVVDAGVSTLTPNNHISALWTQEASLKNTGNSEPGLRGCRFELDEAMSLELHSTSSNSKAQPDKATHFTLLRALWLVWRGSIMYMVNTGNDLPDHALRSFVTANALLTALISKFPRVSSMVEDHISSTLHMNDFESQYPFGPSSIIFNFTLLFMVCLKRPQLHIMLPEVIEALRSFLIPTYVVPVGDNVTEVEFHRYWIFLQSLESCSHILTDERGLSIFTMLERVLHEEERPLRTYPVTRAILKFFRELLVQYPPELWMLSGWHHGILNMSHTSLDMESSNVTHGLDLSYLANLKRYVDTNSYKSNDLYNPFQSHLLCEMFSYVLKTVCHGINDSEFADNGERLEILGDIAGIAHLTCRIFRVYNYDNGKPCFTGVDNKIVEDHWVQGLNELINRILLILSASNYIMELVNILTYQLDLLHYHQELSGASLAMVNPLRFSEVSLSFFTPRSIVHRRLGLEMLSGTTPPGSYASRCQLNYQYRWLCSQERNFPVDQSKRILDISLKFLRELYITALPKNRNPLFNTLAETLGSTFFLKCRNEMEHRARFLATSDQLLDTNDPVVYFAVRQIELMCSKLPQSSVIQSLVLHTYTSSFISPASDIISLYLLLCEQRKLRTGEYIDSMVANIRVMLQQLGNIKGHYDVISQTDKDEICFYEHLITMFLDVRTNSYESRISILQYLLVALSTCSGMEMLWRNNGIDVTALVDFVDSILRMYILHDHAHNLGDVTLGQYALLIFSRLMELSQGMHEYCWTTVTQALRVLIDLWRSFDSNLFIDADVTFKQYTVVPRSTMVKEAWFDTVDPDLYIYMCDSLVERRLGLLRIIGSVYAVLDTLNVYISYASSHRSELPDDFLRLLVLVTMNWDFMDTLFPIIVYDSGFVHNYVKNDVTERKMGHYYRLGLWLGEECSDPLSRLLHHLYDMKISHHHLLMHGDSTGGVEPFNMRKLLSSLLLKSAGTSTQKTTTRSSTDALNIDLFIPLLRDIVGPPEANALDPVALHQAPKSDEATSFEPTMHNDCFYSFGTANEFGHHYLMDMEKFHHLSVVLITSSDDRANVLYSEGMAIVRRHIELIPYIESLNDLKVMILRQLCNLATNFRSLSGDPTSRMQTLVKNDVDSTVKRMIDCTMEPFKMFVFNAAMMLQYMMTLPDCLSEHSLYVGLFIDFLRLVLVNGFDIMKLETSFFSYYDCYRSSGVEGTIVDYIVSQDLVGNRNTTEMDTTSDFNETEVQSVENTTVGQEFRLFAINVFGGLLAQVVRSILEFSRHFQSVLEVDFSLPTSHRRSLKVRLAALDACIANSEGYSNEEDFYMSDAFSSTNRDCMCKVVAGKTIALCNISVWLHFMMCSFFSPLYKTLSCAAKASYELEPRGVEDGALEAYQRMTSYVLKTLYDSCAMKIGSLHKENDRLLQCFVDAGSNMLRNSGVEAAFIFILGPYACFSAIQSVLSTDFNADFLHEKGYSYVVQLAEALTQLPYTTSACISPSIVNVGDFMNPTILMKRDKSYMAECMRSGPGNSFCYQNRNWLRALLYKLFERLNTMLIRGVPFKSVLNGFKDSQLLQRLYLYSFLCNFVQPLQQVNPKTLLANFSDHTQDRVKGSCVEVMEYDVTMWYPAYQSYRGGASVRCPYHLLHCGLLRFLSDMCNAHVTGNTVDSARLDKATGVVPLVLGALHLLRQRTRYILESDTLTLATLEESQVIFAILRHVPSWRRLPDADAALIPELLRASVRYFSTIVQAFQNGLGKISDQIPAQCALESNEPMDRGMQDKLTPRVKDVNQDKRITVHCSATYRQRCLYLALKCAESFVTFLLNTDITLGCDWDLPPTMEQFLKTGDSRKVRRMCAVDRSMFQSLVNGRPLGTSGRTRDIQLIASPHEPSFELMTDALGTCVDLYIWSMRLCRELRSSNKEPFLVGARHDDEGDVRVMLSLYSIGKGEPRREQVDGVDCLVYNGISVLPHSHVDVAPAEVTVSEFQSLFECIIEKSALFCTRAVNTAFLQNQLYPHEDSRSMIKTGHVGMPPTSHSALSPDSKPGSSQSLHSILTLLHNAFSEVAASSKYLSGSTISFCKVLSGQVERRIGQSKLLSDAFGDTYLYLEH
ncbi:nucleoporin FG repeat-containing, putative [Babesia ovis]|uniref:Nucleoporin FG repeat-containing, putative n=1 Tax=Babesia ovis TaxID=5869 RepID=A0A9W5WW66_BABOV|nr:nucleoporin FG repeat-containing, putative [Babesia ovis]